MNVRPSADGKRYEVVAGGRHLKALKLLVKEGRLARDVLIECRVLGNDDDPTEISLVKNTLRVAMHPDDQFEAFRDLIETKGLNAEYVTARFGVYPTLIERRLKFACVLPRLRTRYRKAELSLDQLMAFTLSEAQAPMSVSIGVVKRPEVARYVAHAMIERNWLPAPLCAAEEIEDLVYRVIQITR